jgi:hypothetical protein
VIGIVVTAAVLTHDFSDGINTVNLVLRSGGGGKRAFRWLLVDAAAPAAGAASTLLFHVSEALSGSSGCLRGLLPLSLALRPYPGEPPSASALPHHLHDAPRRARALHHSLIGGRIRLAMETVQLTVAGASDMQAYVARPKAAPTKGIIILQEVFGITPFIQRITKRFAEQGYLAIAPEIFHRTAPPGTISPTATLRCCSPHRESDRCRPAR